jgi:phage/plasmid-like protein (TIGR03299 family)
MSQETSVWLNTMTLIGHTEKRGNAWHYRAEDQDDESNHYPHAIPVLDVERRLFHWTANESPIYVALPATIDDMTGMLDDGTPFKTVLVEGRKAITRSDSGSVLGIFKDGYQPHQPKEWLIENVEMLVGGSLDIGSAGLLKGGAVAWLQVEAEENMFACGDAFRPFILAATSFDGSLSTTYKAGITRTVCDNTLEAALLDGGATTKVKHTRYSNLNTKAIQDTLGLVQAAAATFIDDVETLSNWKVSDKQWAKFLDELCKFDVDAKTTRSKTIADKKRDDLVNLWTNDNRVQPWAGTAYGVVQATNTYAHHIQTVRGAVRAERNMLNAITGVTEKDDALTLKILTGVCN